MIDSCRRFQGAATNASDSAAPGAGGLFWYLVTGSAGGCEGPAGDAVILGLPIARIVNDAGACP